MTETIVHHQDASKFSLTTDCGEAVLEYQLRHAGAGRDATTIDFSYTYVPTACRGKGLAEKLVRHGLQWARQQNLTITASCWYVAKFLR